MNTYYRRMFIMYIYFFLTMKIEMQLTSYQPSVKTDNLFRIFYDEIR